MMLSPTQSPFKHLRVIEKIPFPQVTLQSLVFHSDQTILIVDVLKRIVLTELFRILNVYFNLITLTFLSVTSFKISF